MVGTRKAAHLGTDFGNPYLRRMWANSGNGVEQGDGFLSCCKGLLNDRRHSRDYERLTANSAAMIQISMIRLLLNRLA